jgi:ribosome biogenesis GTPase A
MTMDWFPGHMSTARKEAADTMRRTDLVIEVLDARVPHSSCSPLVAELRRENQRPALKLLNKADAADPRLTEAWLAHYNAQPGVTAIALSSRKASDVARIPALCRQLVPNRGTTSSPLRLMILGIPNVGKSTLMNSLLKRHVANVGDEPAITKMQARFELSPGVWIVDTPGMTWPAIPQDVGIKLAATHSLGRNAYDEETVALDLAGYLLRAYPAALARRFEVDPASVHPASFLEHVARKRSLVAKGGVPDMAKAALAFLTEFRSGVLGPITLETVEEAEARAASRPPPKRKR